MREGWDPKLWLTRKRKTCRKRNVASRPSPHAAAPLAALVSVSSKLLHLHGQTRGQSDHCAQVLARDVLQLLADVGCHENQRCVSASEEKREVRCPLCRRYTPVSADQTAQAEHELNNEGYRKQPVNNLWIQSSTRAESFVAPLPASVQPAAPNLNRTGTLFSSGLDISRSVRNGQDFRGLADGPDVLQGSHGEGNPAVLSLISDGQSLRQALGICPHGHHRSMCRLCDPAGAAERERLQVQGAFDVDPAGTPLRCQSVCALS